MKSYEFFGIYDFTEIAEELTTEELIQVNGGCGFFTITGQVGQACGGTPGCTSTPPGCTRNTPPSTPGCGDNHPPSNPMCGNNPPPSLHPNCPGGFNDDHKYKNQEEELQNYKDDKKRFSELVNTDKLAEIIAGNLDSLDQATKEYFKSLGTEGAEEKIKQILNGVDVYTGVTSEEQQQVFNDLNLETTPNDGLTLGNDIYLADSADKIIDKNGNIKIEIADLLGHEAIHTLQAYVEGEESFIEYCATHSYDRNNDYEVAAYNFGGGGCKDKFGIDPEDQIFDQEKNKEWWKK